MQTQENAINHLENIKVKILQENFSCFLKKLKQAQKIKGRKLMDYSAISPF